MKVQQASLCAGTINALKKRQIEKTTPRKYKAGGNKTSQETHKYGLLPWSSVETILYLVALD
jgi:hypothetical protein